MKTNKIVILTFIIIISFCSITKAQVSFEAVYDSVELIKSFKINDGFLLCGIKRDSTIYDHKLSIMKTDSFGTPRWCKTYVNQFNSDAPSALLSADGSLFIGGEIGFNAGVDGSVFVTKFDTSGTVIWSTAIGGNLPYDVASICFSQDSGIIVAANTWIPGLSSSAIYLCKLDQNGIKQWGRIIGDSLYARVYSLKAVSDGGFILTGHIDPPYSMVLIKTDSLGWPQWRKNYDHQYEDWAFDVIESADSGFAMVGTIFDGDDAVVVKTDKLGNIQWSNTYAGQFGAIKTERILLAKDNNFLLCGSTGNSIGDQTIAICKLDPAGNILWVTTIDSTQDRSWESDFYELSDSSILLTSYAGMVAGTFFLKTDGINTCNTSQQLFSSTPIQLNVDTGISSYAVNDSVWHPTYTVNTINVNSNTICLNISVGIEEIHSGDITIYPNPFNSQLTIATNAKEQGEKQLRVINSLGQEIYFQTFTEDEIRINTESWPEGLFTCIVTSKTIISSKKIVRIK